VRAGPASMPVQHETRHNEYYCDADGQ